GPKLETSLIGRLRIRTLRWEDASWHLAVPTGRLVLMTNSRPLMAEIIARSSSTGGGGDRLTGDALYRTLRALPPVDKVLALFVRFERVLPFLVGSLRGDDLEVRVARSIRSVQLCSNGLESRIAVSFRPGAVTSILGPGQGGGGMRTLDLLPSSPLVYLGVRGPGWLGLWRRLGWEKGLGQGERRRMDRRVERALGLSGLEVLLGLLGREAALAVIDFPRSGLPIPETLAYVEFRDEATARRRLPWLIDVLKRRPAGEMLFRTQRLGERVVYHAVTPVVGTISAVAWGPYFVVSNELKLLQDVVGRKRASPSFFWARMRRHSSANVLAAVDVARILSLAPRLWPHLAGLARLRRLNLRSVRRWVLTGADWGRVLRAVVFWSTWDGRAEVLTLGLRLWLKDTPVRRGLSAAK
ncbi:MAG: hypothetical protein KKC37_09820, partial [Proteobacteria bacterium]|nr:hypothetical protein [Pseudomonadota bacterium]